MRPPRRWPEPGDWDRVVVDRENVAGVQYVPPPDDGSRTVHEIARRETLLRTRDGGSSHWSSFTEGSSVALLGRVLAESLGLNFPVGALAHRSIPLGFHRDTQNPVPCTNLVVIFRDARGSPDDGGLLVLLDARLAFACPDGTVLVFDGQRPHGVTPFDFRDRPDAYRVGLTFYCPLPERATPVDSTTEQEET